MNTRKPKIFWRLDLPTNYFDTLASDCGLVLGQMDENDNSIAFSGDWTDYQKEEYLYQSIVHTSIDIVSSTGERKKIIIPNGSGRYWCFMDYSDSPNLNIYPTIFQSTDKIVSLCHCSSNWDGLSNSSIITICASTGLFINQYFEDRWLKEMSNKYPGLADDIESWSNGSVILYLDELQEQLLIHSDYPVESSLILKWNNSKWEFYDFIPETFQNVESRMSFNWSCSSLNQREIYTK